MTMNLRADDTFVEDFGWHEVQDRYHAFLDAHTRGRVVYLELGVGCNTPGIIKVPFWRMTLKKSGSVLFQCKRPNFPGSPGSRRTVCMYHSGYRKCAETNNSIQ